MDLTKPPNKVFALSVVGVVVLIWVLVWLFGPKPEKIQPGAPVESMLTSLLQSASKGKKEEDKRVEEPIPDTWGRDPFALPRWVKIQEERETRPTKTTQPKRRRESDKQQYKVSTILITGSNRLAVINDRVYAVGDKIGDEEISKITLDHIVLTDNSRERVLRVPQPETQVTVESTEGN